MSLNDWLNLLLRWIHFIAGIAWIGSSFYFIWLDSHLTAPRPPDREVEGSLWMVHSGGFYQVERRRIGPGRMPAVLHWFKWEAALTWISGVLLLTVVYYLTGGIYLTDASVSAISPAAATALGVGAIVVSWIVYDGLWRSPLARRGWLAAAISFALAGGAALGLCRVLSGRAAYMHVGAILGTLMVANVWMRILPAQKKMIDATEAGREPDYGLGEQAKRRSVHNSYMTFPVLFIMLSNHFPGTYGHRLNWIVLVLFILAGAAARHVMIGRGRSRLWMAGAALGALAVLFLLTATHPSPTRGALSPGSEKPTFAAVRAVITSRCVACHSAHPSDATFGAAPAGVTFDDPENIRRLRERIRVRAVETKTMPLANKTGMTEAERSLIARWIAAGAPVR